MVASISVKTRGVIVKLVTMVVTAFLLSSLANAASFQGHTSFTASPVWGRVSISCQENGFSDWRTVICEDVRLSPFEYGYFEAEKDVGATEVLLTSQRADGKSIDKKVGYDSTKGRSEKRMNLWIATLLQTPMLDVGDNLITYQLVNEGEVKASGQLSVKVSMGPEKRCPDAREYSYNMNDCRFPSTVCGRYFQRYNYCQD